MSQTLVSQTRPISTVGSSGFRSTQRATPTVFQRRWQSADAETRTGQEEEESAPKIVAEEPSPQDEVENEIHRDNAAQESPAETAASSSGSSSFVENAINSVKNKVSEASADFVDATAQTTGLGPVSIPPVRKTQAEPKSTIYIGNLFFDVTEADLERELGRFGTVTQARLIRDNRGLSKGYEGR